MKAIVAIPGNFAKARALWESSSGPRFFEFLSTIRGLIFSPFWALLSRFSYPFSKRGFISDELREGMRTEEMNILVA
jgi:hypothetical protein